MVKRQEKTNFPIFPLFQRGRHSVFRKFAKVENNLNCVVRSATVVPEEPVVNMGL